MNRVIAVVEGQTEQIFVRDVLAPWLGWKGVMLSARLVGKPGHKGGIGRFERARNDIVKLLRQESETVVTTMFDYYRMPSSWPGRTEAKSLQHQRKAPQVEASIAEAVIKEFGSEFDVRRLIPYVQMHEFEALLFSEPIALAEVMRNAEAVNKLQVIRDVFDTPEEINDDPATAPSKQIVDIFPYYQKPLHGVLAAKRITVEKIRSQCPHFSDWLTRLENLAPK